jgi:CRP-like cAMP-binding protein
MIQAPTNLLLASLPNEVRNLLIRQLEPVALPVRTVLYEPERSPHYVHLLTSGLASIVTYMREGEAAEVGLVGHEGLAESLHLLGPALLQTNCFMQIAGTGLRMRFKDFERHFERDEPLRKAVLRYVQFQNLTLSQTAACNRLHEVEERLARWLLMVSDRIGSSELRLTQEFLSQMLGARRSTVTLVAGSLQRSGLIEYSRGDVRIINRQGLESVSCECYRVTRDALTRLDLQDPITIA